MAYVFAYGSNLAVARIEARVGVVTTIAVGKLAGHALRFHKIGRDGSGKADAHVSGNSADAVWGVVYEIAPRAKRRLDHFEGLGSEYLEAEVAVATAAGEIACHVYRAHPLRIDASLLPFEWYHRYVVHGARAHALPDAYVAALARAPVRVDPDRTRAERALALLEKS
jgi:gamma-glutamylcyclotransferase